MRKLFLLVMAFALYSCATAEKASRPEFLTGAWDAKTSAEVIKDDLTRGQDIFGYFYIEAFPLTQAYEEASITERSQRRLASQNEIKAEIASDKKSTEGMSCFFFALGANTVGTAGFDSYYAQVIDSAGNRYPVTFATKGPRSVADPVSFHFHQWSNSDTGCIKHVLDFSKPFRIHVTSNVFQNIDAAELSWSKENPI